VNIFYLRALWLLMVAGGHWWLLVVAGGHWWLLVVVKLQAIKQRFLAILIVVL
jgi:hypothetical protein